MSTEMLLLLRARYLHLNYNCELMHKTLAIMLLTALIVVGSGCARASRQAETADVAMTLTAIPYPPFIGSSRLVIKVTGAGGRPINDAFLSIKGDMTHAGMVPVLAEVDGGNADGVYEVPFEWTMAGDWVVTVDAELVDGTSARQRFELAVASESADICEDDEQE